MAQFDESTFNYIGKHKKAIKAYAEIVGVSAGAMAEEKQQTFKDWFFDTGQESGVIPHLLTKLVTIEGVGLVTVPKTQEELGAEFGAYKLGLEEQKDNGNIHLARTWEKINNLMVNDVGEANIKIGTALILLEK